MLIRSVIATAVRRYQHDLGTTTFSTDALKVSHHGSKGNTSPELLRLLDAKRYLFSSSGAFFKHPDAETAARAIIQGGSGTQIDSFNPRLRILGCPVATTIFRRSTDSRPSIRTQTPGDYPSSCSRLSSGKTARAPLVSTSISNRGILRGLAYRQYTRCDVPATPTTALARRYAPQISPPSLLIRAS